MNLEGIRLASIGPVTSSTLRELGSVSYTHLDVYKRQIMVFTRWNSGWRGRRAAVLATFAFVAAVVAWAANYFSAIHRFTAS